MSPPRREEAGASRAPAVAGTLAKHPHDQRNRTADLARVCDADRRIDAAITALLRCEVDELWLHDRHGVTWAATNLLESARRDLLAAVVS